MTQHKFSQLLLKPLLAAALLACASLPALATAVTFSGVTDWGSLNGTVFSGSFAYDEPTAGFDGSVDLIAFSLSFAGQNYALAGADAGFTPMAWFSAGSFLGLDYQDSNAAGSAARPVVTMTAGFTQFSEAYLAYDTTGGGTEGYGSYAIDTVVPEPASLALLLTALGLAGLQTRRRST